MSRIFAGHSTPRPLGRRWVAALGGLLLMVVLTGCSQDTEDQWKRLGLPDAASDRSEYMHDLWIGAWIAAAIVGVFVWGLIFYAVIRFRRRGDDDIPIQIRYNLPIEVLYTVAPIIVVAVLFFFTVKAQDSILDPVDHPDHNVVVTAQRWSWTFNYLHEDAVDGDDVYDAGTPAQDPELWLVKDQSVTFDLNSPDVIHSFWVPSFYFKMDVVPGRDNSFSMTPTKTGTFVGRCAELCGVLHSKMLFTVVVTDQETFDQHMQDLEDAGQVGVLRGGDDANGVDGLAEGATS